MNIDRTRMIIRKFTQSVSLYLDEYRFLKISRQLRDYRTQRLSANVSRVARLLNQDISLVRGPSAVTARIHTRFLIPSSVRQQYTESLCNSLKKGTRPHIEARDPQMSLSQQLSQLISPCCANKT